MARHERLPVLNYYRALTATEVQNYICSLEPPPNCLIAGDANENYSNWEPGITSRNGAHQLASWSARTSIGESGESGVATHKDGCVTDLRFSNIPFLEAHTDPHCISLLRPLPTKDPIPGWGEEQLTNRYAGE
ncbi:hypothetical protein F5B18DRAFT_543974 [Nemania serpens]|nr:hypothetical protein F5B18DRAFT_543974 [Nemania serpens]